MSKNNKRYMMKRRRYGWGWVPVTWQTWLLLVMQFAIVFIASTFLPANPEHPTTSEMVRFLLVFGLAVGTFILVVAQRSPSPRWRWGKKRSDNPDEDF